ncbi:MAG: CatB-related O-acetyltransferase [Verrucomicrobia bacterium]|nr:CatB-related O-acetyltransferase [Verrucomicrobiota bacterium]
MGNVFLKNIIADENLYIGDFTYAHVDHLEGDQILKSLVPYSFADKKLIIGKFCSIGWKVQFISPYANHQTTSFTTYPFWHIFSTHANIEPWLEGASKKGDTVVGNDVWFGRESMVMPGVQIGDGAIIAARATVAENVPPYALVAGNPGKIVKYRFSPEVIEKLLAIQWWNWDLEKVILHHAVLMGNDLEALSRLAHPNLQHEKI